MKTTDVGPVRLPFTSKNFPAGTFFVSDEVLYLVCSWDDDLNASVYCLSGSSDKAVHHRFIRDDNLSYYSAIVSDIQEYRV